MRFDQYFSEEEAYRELLIQSLQGREEQCMIIFVEKGPEELKKMLRLTRDTDWKIVFDYLVFQKDLLKICVRQFMDFFRELVADQGPHALRKILGIEDKAYDGVFEYIFDLVAISSGALFDFVARHRKDFLSQIHQNKGQNIRNTLGIHKKKYDAIWQQIVELLYDEFQRENIDQRILGQGIASFDLMMNILRKHRSLNFFDGF